MYPIYIRDLENTGLKSETGLSPLSPTFSITLPTPPGANRLWRSYQGRTVKSATARAWQAQAALLAKAKGMMPVAGAVALEIVLHPRQTKTGQASKVRLDVDAPIKATMDALQGVAYADDKQVIRVSSELGYPLPKGGITVTVKPL